jgi:fatty-acyl-CoA synthase
MSEPTAGIAHWADIGVAHVRGVEAEPLLEITIGDALRVASRRWPAVDALVSRAENIRWTYFELDVRVDQLAAALLRLGLAPGDRVAVWAPNCAAWTLLQFATARAGLIFVTFNTAYRRQELAHVLSLSGARAIVSVEGFKDIDYAAELAGLEAPALEWRVMLGAEAPDGWLAFEDLFSDDIGPLDTVAVDASDPVNIQFTSGTTGRPKGVTLSHRNILNNGAAVGVRAGLHAGDRLCIPVPLYHCFGMVMGNLACVVHGVTMVYPAPGFEASATLGAIAAERCTHCYGVPTMFIAMLASPDFADHDLSSLRGGIMAGATCPVEVMRRVIDRMNMQDVTIAYGMTETSPVSTQTLPDDPIAARIETVGRVLPHLEVRIVDDKGQVVARGIEGELSTKGYSVMSGYWGDPETTAAAIDADGFMHSGDLASIDADGFVRISGRAKDMIIRGGENISPREIEEFLYSHPDITDVAVIGVADDRFGEAVCAWIVRTPGSAIEATDIAAYCNGQLAHFKTPSLVRFVEALPMTASGKVQKYLMRTAERDQSK